MIVLTTQAPRRKNDSIEKLQRRGRLVADTGAARNCTNSHSLHGVASAESRLHRKVMTKLPVRGGIVIALVENTTALTFKGGTSCIDVFCVQLLLL
jgi:hypothetical protein